MENIQEYIIELLKKEVKPAVGCTEPVAVALGAAVAADLIDDKNDIQEITVEVNRGIYKNGMDVGIPNSDEIGLDIAASLGAAISEPERGLEILGTVSDDMKAEAKEIYKNAKIAVTIADTDKSVYIKTTIKTSKNTAISLLEDNHDNITYKELNGEVLLDERKDAASAGDDPKAKEFYNLDFDTIVTEIENMDTSKLEFLLDGVEMNMKVAERGLETPCGLGVGYYFKKNMDKGLVAEDLSNVAYMLTAAASDVRMSGVPMQVMSSSGSGNNGLTAVLPLAAYRDMYEVSEDDFLKALAISHVITSYVKKYIGRLSNLCGCSLAASIGVGCAIAWLLEDKSKISPTINNILANQSGVICDGAKPGCALKLGTAALTGVQSALIAVEGTVITGYNGIVEPSAEQNVRNLSKISSVGMAAVDNTVIDIMLDRK